MKKKNAKDSLCQKLNPWNGHRRSEKETEHKITVWSEKKMISFYGQPKILWRIQCACCWIFIVIVYFVWSERGQRVWCRIYIINILRDFFFFSFLLHCTVYSIACSHAMLTYSIKLTSFLRWWCVVLMFATALARCQNTQCKQEEGKKQANG